jgi:hypothetical protein
MLDLMAGKLRGLHKDLQFCECGYIGTCKFMNVLDLMTRKLVRVLRDLWAHVFNCVANISIRNACV